MPRVVRFTPDTDLRSGATKRRGAAVLKLLRREAVRRAPPERLAFVLQDYLRNHALTPGVPKAQRRNERAFCEAMQKIIDSKTSGLWPEVEYDTMDADHDADAHAVPS